MTTDDTPTVDLRMLPLNVAEGRLVRVALRHRVQLLGHSIARQTAGSELTGKHEAERRSLLEIDKRIAIMIGDKDGN